MFDASAPPHLSVSDLLTFTNSTLAGMGQVLVQGEIGEISDKGNMYFTLKDAESDVSIGAVLFASDRQANILLLKGTKIQVVGSLKVYEKTGALKLIIKKYRVVDGIGEAFRRFMLLKEKLAQEGLFAQEHKKQLPQFPQRIALVTSETGAALQDMRKIACERWPFALYTLYPCQVQGNVAKQVVASLQAADAGGHEIIILARGGGSYEDLALFNDEQIARTVYVMKTPIISAIGHQTDTTIADYVSDVAAATPSEAISYLPSHLQTLQNIHELQQQIHFKVQTKFYSYERVVQKLRQSLPNILEQLTRQIGLVKNLQLQNTNVFDSFLQKLTNTCKTLQTKLDALSPLAVLQRGYALVYQKNKIIANRSKVRDNMEIEIQFGDGRLRAWPLQEAEGQKSLFSPPANKLNE